MWPFFCLKTKPVLMSLLLFDWRNVFQLLFLRICLMLLKKCWTTSLHLLLQCPLYTRKEESPLRVQNCVYWQEVGRMKTLGGTARFPNFTRLAKCVLSLPVSNADTERVFSIVRNIVTDYRTEMEQSTLCALVSCKLNSSYNCFDLEIPKELLKYNRAHRTQT